MIRHEWHTLPEKLRDAVQGKCGEVVKTETPSAGRNSDFAATLHLAIYTQPTFDAVATTTALDPARRHRPASPRSYHA